MLSELASKKEGMHAAGLTWRSKCLHLDEPLLADQGLNHLATALAARHTQRVRLLLQHQARNLHVLLQVNKG